MIGWKQAHPCDAEESGARPIRVRNSERAGPGPEIPKFARALRCAPALLDSERVRVQRNAGNQINPTQPIFHSLCAAFGPSTRIKNDNLNQDPKYSRQGFHSALEPFNLHLTTIASPITIITTCTYTQTWLRSLPLPTVTTPATTAKTRSTQAPKAHHP